jgi:hypothetical protein
VGFEPIRYTWGFLFLKFIVSIAYNIQLEWFYYFEKNSDYKGRGWI